MQRVTAIKGEIFPNWDPMGNRFHCALRDAGYLLMDFPRTVFRVQTKYGLFMKYLKNRRKGKENKPEDFVGIETHELRHMLQLFHFMKGPLQRLDLRIFNWMYYVLFVYCMIQFYSLNERKKKMLEDVEVPLSERRKIYTDDYEEDLKPK